MHIRRSCGVGKLCYRKSAKCMHSLVVSYSYLSNRLQGLTFYIYFFLSRDRHNRIHSGSHSLSLPLLDKRVYPGSGCEHTLIIIVCGFFFLSFSLTFTARPRQQVMTPRHWAAVPPRPKPKMPTISEVENHPRYLFKLTDSPSPEHHVLIKKEYDLESTTNVNAVNNNSHVVIQGFNLKSPFTEEPLDLSTLKSRKRKTHSNCGARNCCHQRGSSLSNTEVLLNPELFLVDGSASTNPLLEMCLDGGLRAEKRPKLEPLSPLLESCSAKRFDFYQLQALKERLRQIQGCDINQVHGQQESALHLLIKGRKAAAEILSTWKSSHFVISEK